MARRFMILISLFCLSAAVNQSRAEVLPDSIRDQAWNDAWSYSSAVIVMDDFERIYLPHAKALLQASEKYVHGDLPEAIAPELNALPGVRGTVFVKVAETGSAFQIPDGIVNETIFPDRFFEDLERPLAWRAPMLKRTMGGQVRYKTFEQGDESLYFVVRYIMHDTLSPPDAAIFLALDPEWFRGQIVARMDSLARENRHLLFWAASPTNTFEEQSLGILWGSDTLWWAGPKNIKVTNRQPLWPFAEKAAVHSFIRSIGKK
jgi:hypothetical protein